MKNQNQKTYAILSHNEATPITKTEFMRLLRMKDENGKAVYGWCDDGEYDESYEYGSRTNRHYRHGDNNYLIPLGDKSLAEIYRIYHNDIARQQMLGIRRKRAGFSINPMPTHVDDDGNKIEIEYPDETDDVETIALNDALLRDLHAVLGLLTEYERYIVDSLYGVDKHSTMSLQEFATSENMKYSSARSLRDSVLRKLLRAHTLSARLSTSQG
jgi:hypothetical protein